LFELSYFRTNVGEIHWGHIGIVYDTLMEKVTHLNFVSFTIFIQVKGWRGEENTLNTWYTHFELD
jgi:hypothetical protein